MPYQPNDVAAVPSNAMTSAITYDGSTWPYQMMWHQYQQKKQMASAAVSYDMMAAVLLGSTIVNILPTKLCGISTKQRNKWQQYHMMAAVLLGPPPFLMELPTIGAGLTHRFLAAAPP